MKLTTLRREALHLIATSRTGELTESYLKAHGVKTRTLDDLYNEGFVVGWGSASGPSWEITSAGSAALKEHP